MKHKTWFVLLVGLAAPELIRHVGGYTAFVVTEGPLDTNLLGGFVHTVAAPLLQTAFGIYLMTGGSWFLNKFIPSNHPYCPECGYDLTHNTGPKCSECGVALPKPAGSEE